MDGSCLLDNTVTVIFFLNLHTIEAINKHNGKDYNKQIRNLKQRIRMKVTSSEKRLVEDIWVSPDCAVPKAV